MYNEVVHNDIMRISSEVYRNQFKATCNEIDVAKKNITDSVVMKMGIE